MKIRIGSNTYTAISDLGFSPEVDVTSSVVSTNEFTARIRTEDSLQVGEKAYLYDDLDNLWASYWLMDATEVETGTRDVLCQSAIRLLDNIELPAIMYSGTTVEAALQVVLSAISGQYTVGTSIANKQLNGFCPKQSARVRLQWICMVAGAYVKTFFSEKVVIDTLREEDYTLIPMAETYWKPSVEYGEYVTEIRATYFTYIEREPIRTEKSVEADGHEYVEVATEVSLRNTEVPSIVPENVVTLDSVTLVNQSNVDDVMAHLAKTYFKRIEMDMEVVNNAKYYPGQSVAAFADADRMMVGHIKSCSFTFGLQSKAKVHLVALDDIDSAVLNIKYTWNDDEIAFRHYRLPVGYAYSITNPYVSIDHEGHWYLLRPTAAKVEGTMPNDTLLVTQPEELALDAYEGDLHIISVDTVTLTDGVAVIE